MHAYLAVLIRSDAIVACIALGDANPKCITYTSELEAMGLGDFVGTAGSFSSLDVGILKLHDKPSEVFDSLLDIGFNAIILNPVAVEAFASENGYSAVSAPVVIELLRSVSDASCNGV